MSTQTNHAPTEKPTTHANRIVAMVSMARRLKTSLLDPRRVYLKGKAPKTVGNHQTRRSIDCGKQRPFEAILSVSYDDLTDGVPLGMVTQWAQEYLTEMERFHAALERRQSSGILPIADRLCRAAVRETKAQAVGDIDMQEVLAEPSNTAKIRAAISALQVEEAERENLQDLLTEVLIATESR